MATAVSYGAIPFREQIEFFRRKLAVGTTSYADIYGPEHDWAFVVAGANRNDLLTDFYQAVEGAIANGRTLEQFRQDFDRIVAKHGWDYNGSRNWRSKTIYDSNLRSSYAAGRYEQLQAVKERRPWWRYNHSDAVEHPRPHHLAWNGLVLHADDPWWRTHFCPNGWGCQCYITAHNDRDLARMGKKGPDKAPPITYVDQVVGKNSATGPRTVRVPEGIDPGWEHAPGRSRLESAVPMPMPAGRDSVATPSLPNRRTSDPLPPPLSVNPTSLPRAGEQPEVSVARFLEVLGSGDGQPAIVEDVLGERLVVGPELFRSASGEWAGLDDGKGRLLPLLAQAIIEPDEIWVQLVWIAARRQAVVRRRYVARFLIQGEKDPTLVVFELGSDGWLAIIEAQDTQLLDAARVGLRLYGRTGP